MYVQRYVLQVYIFFALCFQLEWWRSCVIHLFKSLDQYNSQQNYKKQDQYDTVMYLVQPGET